MNLKKIYLFLLLISQLSVFSQTSIWTKTTQINNSKDFEKLQLNINDVDFFELNPSELQKNLFKVPLRSFSKSTKSKSTITLPILNGGFDVFEIYEVSVLAPELAEKYPNIKSYVGYSKNLSGVKLRMSNSPLGLETLIIYPDKQNLYMKPVVHGGTSYVLYQSDNIDITKEGFECGVLDSDYEGESSKASTAKNANDQLLRKFRLAVSTTGEYTAFFGGTKAGALAGINTVVNRINEVFETDISATFEVVANTDVVVFTDATTDPYADVQDDWNSDVQTTLTALIGEENYDIGHLFSPLTGSGVLGNAGCIGCVCEDNRKGSAFSRPISGDPDGPRFEETFIHELGHQMGATHTYSAQSEGPNFTQTEPGAGSTIMGTGAGGSPVTDSRGNYFHYFSIFQITNNIASKACPTTTPITNNPPTVNAGSDFTIPARTAYVLKGSANDPDGTDNLFYTWEQLDVGIVTSATFGPTLAEGAMNRSLPPSTNSDRYIPNISRVLAGQLTETSPARGDDWETVSNVSRDLNWGLTVRDREAVGVGLGGQTDSDEMLITVTADAGPFTVTSQNAANIVWAVGSSQEITWFVGGTDANGINTSNVNILLSTDGGQTYPVTLASNVPNNGTYTLASVPNITSPICRIKVEPVDNIYYAINAQNFTIGNFVQGCTRYSSASNLNLAIPEGAGFLGPLPGTPLETTITVPSSNQIESITLFADITHSNISNIDIELIHPNGVDRVKVWDLTCNDENDLSILFDDSATNAIVCEEPTTGTYQPINALSAFNGLDPTGDWTLRIIDYRTSDTGVLNNWYIEICGLIPVLNTSEFNFASEVVLFPNPNQGSFNLKLNSTNSNNIDVEVFDLRGRSVYKKLYPNTGSSFDESINLSGVKAGLYLVNIKDGNLKASKKIIVN